MRQCEYSYITVTMEKVNQHPVPREHDSIMPQSYSVIFLLCSLQDLQGFGCELVSGNGELLILRDIVSQHDMDLPISIYQPYPRRATRYQLTQGEAASGIRDFCQRSVPQGLATRVVRGIPDTRIGTAGCRCVTPALRRGGPMSSGGSQEPPRRSWRGHCSRSRCSLRRECASPLWITRRSAGVVGLVCLQFRVILPIGLAIGPVLQ